MDGWMVKCTDGRDLHSFYNIHTVRKRKKTREKKKSKMLAKTINNKNNNSN
jgi:hypothetical protein